MHFITVMDIERDIDQAQADINNAIIKKPGGQTEVDPDVITRAETPKASWADFTHHFSQWKNLKVLIGTSYSWFALDVRPFPLFPFHSVEVIAERAFFDNRLRSMDWD